MKLTGLILKILLLISVSFFLSGCQSSILNPQGQVGVEERSIILTSFLMMLIIIIPVIVMTIFFSFKYNSNKLNSEYSPNWSHSNKIEMIIWGVPIIIIFCLANIAWKSTHYLDPKKSLVSYANVSPIKIDVIALDWKWLFIYPDKNIATINKIVFPINRPIIFRITSYSVMNSFFIPLLGSQIYAMPGMQTDLNLIANKIGILKGISSNFSGRGFSGMKFAVVITKNDLSFNNWIKLVKKSSKKLNSINQFEKITKQDENHIVEYFSDVTPDLFNKVIKKIY